MFDVGKESGFSLVELLVGMAVTLVALGATVMAFRDSSYTNQRVAMKSDISDNLRAGMNFIQQDLIQAGTGIPVGGIPIPNTGVAAGGCSSGVSALNRPSLADAGMQFPNCNTTLAAVEPGDGLGNTINSPDATSVMATDLITLMYVDNTLGLDKKPI
ncbi:MAG TPA: prepilin-type N-terminal cleavage/methylation domain-containing protein, partial [Candidatus Acidoferrum sp.]